MGIHDFCLCVHPCLPLISHCGLSPPHPELLCGLDGAGPKPPRLFPWFMQSCLNSWLNQAQSGVFRTRRVSSSGFLERVGPEGQKGGHRRTGHTLDLKQKDCLLWIPDLLLMLTCSHAYSGCKSLSFVSQPFLITTVAPPEPEAPASVSWTITAAFPGLPAPTLPHGR